MRPGIVVARIKRADRHSKDGDLDLIRVRDDLTEADLATLSQCSRFQSGCGPAVVRRSTNST